MKKVGHSDTSKDRNSQLNKSKVVNNNYKS